MEEVCVVHREFVLFMRSGAKSFTDYIKPIKYVCKLYQYVVWMTDYQ